MSEHVGPSPACLPGAYPACLTRLASIETKIDLLLTAKVDQEARLRALEAVENQAKGTIRTIIGLSSIFGALIGAVVSWVLTQLHKT